MTRELALRFLEAMLAGDQAAMATMLAPDVVWHLPPFSKQPPIHGRDGVLRFAREAQAAYYQPGTLRFEPALVVADANGAALLGTLLARTKHGKDYENLYTFGLRFDAGKVAEGWELVDSARFVELMR